MGVVSVRELRIGRDPLPLNNAVLRQPDTPDGTLDVTGALFDFAGMPRVGGAAIVERSGDRDSGYMRFADGTQICFLLVQANASCSIASAGGYRSGTVTTPWPAGFIVGGEPRVAGSTSVSDALVYRADGDSANVHMNWWRAASATVSTDMRLIAIGRWF